MTLINARFHHSFTTRAILLLAVAPSLSALGCVADSTDATDLPESAVASAAQASTAPTCVILQRGVAGAVADAKLRDDQPGVNFGTIPTFVTGNTSANRAALLQFDLGAIPPGQMITSATVTLGEVLNQGASTISVHAVTAPWSEGSVTWNSFNNAYDPAVETSFSNGGAGHTGPVSFDVSALAQSWYSGSLPNDGVALLASTNSTWASSESTTVAARPSLQVCYQAPPPVVLTSALVQANDGGAWQSYAPCGLFHLYLLDAPSSNAGILNNSDDTLSVALADGTHQLGLLGTDGNTPGSTQTLTLSFNGTSILLDETPGATASAVIGSKLVTVSGFSYTIPTDQGYSPLDRVAVCGVYPDGYVDSYGQVTVTVAPAP